MATIGIDCELILDGIGYFIKPGKRVWSMVILCLNNLTRYDGTSTGVTGQQYRDALRTSYTDSTGTTLLYSDPLNTATVAVHFDSYKESVTDLHIQQAALGVGGTPGLSYEVMIELIEA